MMTTEWMEVIILTQLAATMGMLGAIWVVQTCVHPRFVELCEDQFVSAHLRHCMGIGIVVVPLMIIELLSACLLAYFDRNNSLHITILALTLGTWLSTATIQAPQHTKLMKGYDADRCRALTRGNWIRTGLWTIKAALVFKVAIQV